MLLFQPPFYKFQHSPRLSAALTQVEEINEISENEKNRVINRLRIQLAT